MTINATQSRLPPGDATEGGNGSGASLLSRTIASSDARLSSILLRYLDRWRKFIFVGIACLYLLGFNGQWLVEPDGGLYLNLARNLASGRGYTYGGERQQTVYPGLPVALAPLYRLFSTHFVFAADVFIFLCALATLALLYRLILLAYDRSTAVAIVIGLALSHEFFRYSFEILSDMPFLMGVMAVLTGHEAIFGAIERRARWWDWLMLIAGLVIAITTRPTMIGLMAAWIITLLWLVAVRRNMIAGWAILICSAMVAVFLLCDPRRFGEHGVAGGYEQYAMHQLSHPHELATTAAANLSDLLGLTMTKASFGMSFGPTWVNVIAGLVAIAAAVALIAKRLFWGLWVIITLATLVMFVSNDRYLLAILPLTVVGWWSLLRTINLRLPRRVGNALFVALLIIGLGPNFAQAIGTIIQQRSTPFLATYQHGRFQPFSRFIPQVTHLTSPNDILICPPKTARMMAFWTDRVCYEPNEPYVHDPSQRVYAILDPTDADYMAWLRAHDVTISNIAAQVEHVEGQPDLALARTAW
jgi:hypothetical protein